jgi:hypothetical protein
MNYQQGVLPITSGYMRERFRKELKGSNFDHNLQSTSPDNLLRNIDQRSHNKLRISTQQGMAIHEGQKQAEAYITRVQNYKVMQKRQFANESSFKALGLC